MECQSESLPRMYRPPSDFKGRILDEETKYSLRKSVP